MKTWLITLSLFFSLISNNHLIAQLITHEISDAKESSVRAILHDYHDIDQKNNKPQRYIISVYPNPARHNLYIEGDFLYYNLFNTSGKKILSDNKARLDISDLRSGMYVMTIHSKNKNYQSKRIMIR